MQIFSLSYTPKLFPAEARTAQVGASCRGDNGGFAAAHNLRPQVWRGSHASLSVLDHPGAKHSAIGRGGGERRPAPATCGSAAAMVAAVAVVVVGAAVRIARHPGARRGLVFGVLVVVVCVVVF